MKAEHVLNLLLLFFCTVCAAGCSDDEAQPLSLHGIEGHTIELYYGASGGVTIIGGGGGYSFTCDSPLLKAKMTHPNYILFEPLGIGKAEVTVQDRFGETYELTVNIVYRVETYEIFRADVVVEGENLTEEQQVLLKERVKSLSLVQPGDFLQFIYTEGEVPQGSYEEKQSIGGVAHVFLRTADKELHGTFEQAACYMPDNRFSHYEYLIRCNGGTYSYTFTHLENGGGTKVSVIPRYIPFFLVEDFTERFNTDFPEVEKVRLLLCVVAPPQGWCGTI